MKMRQGKIFALLLSLALLLPIMGYQSAAVAYAATPTFGEQKKEISGEGQTYQIEIKDKVSGSTYKWSSSNAKVAKVNSKGVVTAIGKGSATIKCKITYPNAKTKTLSSKITVVIPSTEVRINNAKVENGAHVLTLGESFDYNRDIFPKGSSDKTHWTIAGGDIESIRIDDNGSGKITATKIGKVILKATAVKSRTEENIKNSPVYDLLIIDVIEPDKPVAMVNSVDIIDSTEIRVVFNTPVNPSTIIGPGNVLLDSVKLTISKNSKDVLANDPGKLTGVMSTDNRTLTIQTEKMLDGEYGINITSKVTTPAGLAVNEYFKQLSFKDNIAPFIKEIKLDDTGMSAVIYFNEAIDFTGLNVSNATLVKAAGGTGAESGTLNVLNNKLNYVASADKKALTINLSKIAYSDYGKTFAVTLSGIKDLSGNMPSTYTLTAYLHTDNSQKPQPKLLYVTRTGYNTITAVFDRSVQYGGQAQVNNMSLLFGVVDELDPKKVNFTLYDMEAILTGIQTVKVGFWLGYNPIPTDQSSNVMQPFSVNFTTDQTSPMLMSFEFDAKTNILTLNYNEEVVLGSNTGIFSTTLRTVTDEIRSGTNINYTKVESTDKKVLKLLITNMALSGNYTFTLDQNFVKDNFRNSSIPRTITIGNAGTTANELPGPYAITQSTENLSMIYLEFANMLDVASATTLSNYSIPGITVLTAEIKNNTKDNGATVLLTVADGSIDVTLERPVTVRGVKGYNGSFSEIKEFSKMVELKENKKPSYLGTPAYDKSELNVIRLNFSENIKGTMSVRVVYGNTQGGIPVEIPSTVTVEGASVVITLAHVPNNNTFLRIEILESNITDLNGNKVPTLPSAQGVVINHY